MSTGKKVWIIISSIIVVAVAIFVFFKFFYVFGSGVKAGELNLFVYKGYVFKTYEGRLIQAGYNSQNTNATIQSNEFNFSVTDEKVAKQLERCAGKFVELHYKEYLGRLRDIALGTWEEIRGKVKPGTKIRFKLFLLKHFPGLFYGLIRKKR